MSIGAWVGRVTLGERADESLFLGARRRTQHLCLRTCRKSRFHRAGLHRVVDIGPENQRFAPVAHRATWIGRLRRTEGAPSLTVVEGVSEAQTLVKIILR